jgi:hypothetical protein
MLNFLNSDFRSEVSNQRVLMSTIRNMGLVFEDPLDDLLEFDDIFHSILKRRVKSDSGDLMVGSIINYIPPYGYYADYYFNPFTSFKNGLIIPAMAWASMMVILGGPWETIFYWY